MKQGSSGEWEHTEMCMGDDFVCTGDLVGTDRQRYILSFGEDEKGELYILTTSNPSPTATKGIVYRIVDPSRYIVFNYVMSCVLDISARTIN